MSEAYEQIWICPDHIVRTAFATILSTFRSQVIQMGGCDSPSMFQPLMTATFCNCISHFVHVHVYMDDIFIFSQTITDYKKHLGIVFHRLCDNCLLLSKKKVDCYSLRMECLGHIIDNLGIHADADKMQCIHEWRRPQTFNDVKHFLSLIQYLAHYMPDVSTYTTPLSGSIHNNHPFAWTLLMDKCFENMKALACKALACKAPILHSIDTWNPDPIWVITNSLKSGVGAMYGQGPKWKTCRLAGFLLKKFSASQQCYKTHKHKMIALLKALMKWEDKLLGHKFTLVTNHKGLKYFETQKNLSDQQVRWWEFLSHLNFNTIPVYGAENKIVDCLSCYFENDNTGEENLLEHTFVNAEAP